MKVFHRYLFLKHPVILWHLLYNPPTLTHTPILFIVFLWLSPAFCRPPSHIYVTIIIYPHRLQYSPFYSLTISIFHLTFSYTPLFYSVPLSLRLSTLTFLICLFLVSYCEQERTVDLKWAKQVSLCWGDGGKCVLCARYKLEQIIGETQSAMAITCCLDVNALRYIKQTLLWEYL